MSTRTEAELAGFDAVFEDVVGDLSPLRDALVGLLGAEARLRGAERFEPRVRRLRVEGLGCLRSVIVKQLDPVVAYRNSRLAERWLPAVGLDALGPGLLACAAEPDGRRAWHIYQDWGNAGLDRDPNDRRRVRAAVRAIAGLHLRFANHALLGECRLWGGDLGRAFYCGNARDALRALEAMVPGAVSLPGPVEVAREGLMAQLQRLIDEEGERGRELEEYGGPDTLVHGDLWPKNVFVCEADDRLRVRLIDWDHAGVAGFSYDLSTLLLRFPSAQRECILADYAEAVERQGWRLPDIDTLNGLFDTAERARIASQIVWPALALLRNDPALRDWSLGVLREIHTWFDELAPVLAPQQSAVA